MIFYTFKVYHQADIIDGPTPLHSIPPLATENQVDKIKTWTSDDLHNWMVKQNLPK